MIAADQLTDMFRSHGFDHIAVLQLPISAYHEQFSTRQQQLEQDGVGDMQWLLRNAALRADPKHVMAEAQSVVVTLLPYHPEAADHQIRRHAMPPARTTTVCYAKS